MMITCWLAKSKKPEKTKKKLENKTQPIERRTPLNPKTLKRRDADAVVGALKWATLFPCQVGGRSFEVQRCPKSFGPAQVSICDRVTSLGHRLIGVAPLESPQLINCNVLQLK